MKKQEKEKLYYSTIEAAKLLGVSRVSVFKWIGKLQLKAKKIGGRYAIPAEEIHKRLQNQELSDDMKHEIDNAVKKTVKEYKETLKLLGDA